VEALPAGVRHCLIQILAVPHEQAVTAEDALRADDQAGSGIGPRCMQARVSYRWWTEQRIE